MLGEPVINTQESTALLSRLGLEPGSVLYPQKVTFSLCQVARVHTLTWASRVKGRQCSLALSALDITSSKLLIKC